MLIDLDDTITWPAPALDLLDKRLDVLAEEANAEQRSWAPTLIAREEAETPVTTETIEEIAGIVAGETLLTYHQTRLDAAGLASLQERGLRGFSEDSLLETLHRLAGAMPALGAVAHRFDHAVRVEHRHHLKERYNRVCLSTSRDHLRDGAALMRLGGEALQILLERLDTSMVLVESLSEVGESLVLRVALPIDMAEGLDDGVAKSMLGRFLNDRERGGTRQAPAINMVGVTVPPEMILSIERRNLASVMRH